MSGYSGVSIYNHLQVTDIKLDVYLVGLEQCGTIVCIISTILKKSLNLNVVHLELLNNLVLPPFGSNRAKTRDPFWGSLPTTCVLNLRVQP